MCFSDCIASLLSYVVPRMRERNNDIVTIIKGVLNDHDMISSGYPSLCSTNEELESALRKEIEDFGFPSDHMSDTCHLAASLVELAYHECTFDEKKQIAMYNWYMIYIDNRSRSVEDLTPYVAFEERFLGNLPQIDPVLNGLSSILRAMFKFYPVDFANSIISSSLVYITETCTEASLEKLELARISALFPYFLRHRTGASVAYGLMLFPNSRPIIYATCFPALPDIDFWIWGTNDVLSYYKESNQGETANYISIRAIAEGKAPLEVAADIRRELLQSRSHIYETLTNSAGKEAVKIWRAWEHGYM
ncbi:hypothetical protein C0995_014695 [Termitomyces sp. Mi166|nr:hypothetical protein C0995_014695 [Termitomyces sp. Mi166\